MTFDELLSRADDQTLQELIGAPAVGILRLIEPKLATPGHLRELITELKSPVELLRNRKSRSNLLTLLPRPEAQDLAELLTQKDVENPYSVLENIKVRKNSAKEGRLLSFFSVFAPEDSEERQRPSQEEVLAQYGLFPHQRIAANHVIRFTRSDSRRVLLHMPTGAGKTRTTMSVIAEHLRTNQDSLVVWLAYSEELCEQAVEEFKVAWQALGNRSLAVHRFWGPHAVELDELQDGLLVGGLAKMYNAAKESISWLATLADMTTLVIIDEAHQAIAETYKLVLNGIKVKNPQTALLGLTATPGRTWNNPEEDEKLARFFNRQKVTLEAPTGQNPVEYLIECGFLARPRFISLTHGGTLQLNRRDERALSTHLDIPMSILERLAEDERRNLAIVQKLEELARSHQRILVFATTVEHAKLLSVVLRSRGLIADAITGQTPIMERRRIIQRFRSAQEDPMILCNYGVLTTGFDAPRTSAAVIARPTKSLVLFSQMLGRAIRGPRAGGNETADVVTVIDPSLPGFGDIGEAFLNWEDVW